MCPDVLGEVIAVGEVAGVPIADLRSEVGPRRISLLCRPDSVAPGDVVLVQFRHAVAVLDPEADAEARALQAQAATAASSEAP